MIKEKVKLKPYRIAEIVDPTFSLASWATLTVLSLALLKSSLVLIYLNQILKKNEEKH